MTSRVPFSLNPLHLLLIIFPLAIFFLGEFFIEGFGDHQLSFNSLGIDRAANQDRFRIEELASRYWFFIAYIFYIFVCLCITFYFAYDFVRHFSWTSQIIVAAVIAIVFALFYLTIAITPDQAATAGQPSRPHTYQYLGSEIFHEAFRDARITSCDDGAITVLGMTIFDCRPRSGVDEPYMLRLLRQLFDFANIFTGIAWLSVIVGSISCLARPGRKIMESLDEDARISLLRKQIVRSNIYLYLSAVLMVVLIIVFFAWIHWPLFVVQDTPLEKSINSLTGALWSYYGLYFSMIIISYYLPTAYLLSLSIARAGEQELALKKLPITHHSLDDWKQRSALGLGFSGLAERGALMLSPLLTTVATTLAGNLFSVFA